MGSEVELELEDRWWLGLRGWTLRSIDTHDYVVSLNFEKPAKLTVEAAAYLQTPTERSASVVIERRADGTLAAHEELFDLAGQRVLSSVAFKSGDLRLVFDSGSRLNITHGQQYEPWQLTGPSARMWVSLPGGGLAVFPPTTT